MATDPQFYNDQEETRIMPKIDIHENVGQQYAPEPPLKENSPSVTRPQQIAALIGGIPVLANLTSAFGIWAPTAKQIDALEQSADYGWKVALALVGSDAIIRFARNLREGRKASANADIAVSQNNAAAMQASVSPAPVTINYPDHGDKKADR